MRHLVEREAAMEMEWAGREVGERPSYRRICSRKTRVGCFALPRPGPPSKGRRVERGSNPTRDLAMQEPAALAFCCGAHF